MTPQAQPVIDPEGETYAFNSRELARLSVYRAAIVAGFYNDELDRADLPRRQALHASSRHNASAPR